MERRHDLDAIRVCAFFLLVLYHVGMYYVSWDWHVKSPFAGETLEPFMLMTGPWRLSLLFLVSGAASAFLWNKSSKGFLGARSWRLLLPLIFGMLVIVTPQAYYEVLDSRMPGGFHDGYLAFWGRYLANDPNFCDDDGCLDVPTWNHLWFVAYLWVYTVALWLLARFTPGLVERMSSALGRTLAGAGVILVPWLWLAGIRIGLLDRFPSTHGLFDDLYNHLQYFPQFLLGFLLARSTPFWEQLQRVRWWSLGLAVASYALLILYFYGSGYDDANPAPDWLRMTQRAVWALNQWCAVSAIFGFGYRFRHADSAWLRYLVPAVFPVYILHQTIIVTAAYNLRPLALPALPEGLLLVVLTFGLCFAGYEVIRRVPLLRPLFGLKFREALPIVKPVPAVLASAEASRREV